MSDSVISFDINFKDLEKVQELLTKVKADASEEIKINVKATGNNINKLDKDVKNFNKDLGQTSKKFSEIFEKGKSLTLAFGKGIFAGGLALGAAAIGNLSSNKFTSKEARAAELYLSSKELIALQKAGRYAGQDENFLVNAADTVSTKSRQVDQTGNFAAFGVNGLQDKDPLEQLQIIMDTYSEKYNSSTDKAYRDQLTQNFSQLTGIGYQTASKIAESGGWEGNFKDNYIDALSRLKEINTDALKEGERIMDSLFTELSQSLAEISAAFVPILKEVVDFLVPAIGKFTEVIVGSIGFLIEADPGDKGFKGWLGELKQDAYTFFYSLINGKNIAEERYNQNLTDLEVVNEVLRTKDKPWNMANYDFNKDSVMDSLELFLYKNRYTINHSETGKNLGLGGNMRKNYDILKNHPEKLKKLNIDLERDAERLNMHYDTKNKIFVEVKNTIEDRTKGGVTSNTTATASEAMVTGANNSLK